MKRLATLLFIFLMIISISAQDSDVQFENISTFSGLSASQAKCIFQDSEGYLWIGTMGGGLNRYDGYSFIVSTNQIKMILPVWVIIMSTAWRKMRMVNIWIATGDGDFKIYKE